MFGQMDELIEKYNDIAKQISDPDVIAKKERAISYCKVASEYNKANGTNIGSVQEFNKSVLKDYTWTERVGNAAKSTVADAKNKFGKFKNNVKENFKEN